MACVGNVPVAVLRSNPLNPFPARTQFLTKAQGIRFPESTPWLPNRSVRSVTNDRSLQQIAASGGQCAERNVKTAAKNMMHVTSPCAFVDSEIIALPAALEGNGVAIEENYPELLKRRGLAHLPAWEAFAISGEITEANMERLVQSLVDEEGQSTENYHRRAIVFGKIAEFFSQGKAYSVEREKSWTGAPDVASAMEVIVDVVLAEEGRSATDYNCRAQLFTKSAEVFPFSADIRSS